MVSSGAVVLQQSRASTSNTCWSMPEVIAASAAAASPVRSSTTDVEFVDGDLFARLVNEDDICVLDCRTSGTPIAKATRVHLPHVLLRRLQAGTLPLASLCERLRGGDEVQRPRVVVVPELKGNGSESPNGVQPVTALPPPRSPRGEVEALSVSLVRALKTADFAVAVLAENIDSVLARWPRIAAPGDDESDGGDSNSGAQSDVDSRGGLGDHHHPSALNLKSLTISVEGSHIERRPSGQRFPVQILPHLYLGNAETAANDQVLKRYNIRSIVNVTSNLPNVFEDSGAVRYLRIPVDDNASHNLADYFPSAIGFINEAAAAGTACLVHCVAGISRSVTVCLAYLMATHRWTLEDAYDLVQRRNAAIAPNFHFMGQLHEFERQLGLVPQSSSGAAPSSATFSRSIEMRSPSASDTLPQSCLTPPPTSCSTSPQSSSHSTKSHTFTD